MFWTTDLKSACVVLFFFSAVLFFHPKDNLNTKVKILPPPAGLEHFHLGFNDITADLLWLSFIQQSDQCALGAKDKEQRCPHRWGYRTLNLASKLSKKSKPIYLFGAVNLSVMLDDHSGAVEILERGLIEYPTDWVLPYRAAYVYMDHIQNEKRAAELMERAAQNGAPEWTRSLASKLYSRAGHLELSFRVLRDLYESSNDEGYRKSLEKRLLSLKAEINL